jgi:hypothetical protein
MSDHPKTMIGVKTATALYVLLLVASFITLKGKALGLALIIVLGLAFKSYLHYWKEKSE